MTDITENLYAERDIMAMGNYYMRHVDRMTREGLHAKSDIAAELGFRDMEIDRLRARVAELEAQERGGWIRTSGWSNELYSFDRSDNEDGTFALTVSERDGKRLVEIDRLTASDLERIVEIVGDGVVV